MQEITIHHKELRCDFCGELNPQWVYPVDDFTQELDPDSPYEFEMNLLGSWGACETCHGIIEENDREKLLDNSLDSYDITEDSRVYKSVRSRIQRLHDEFFFSRSGEATLESEFIDPSGYEPGVMKIEVVDNV